MPADTSREPRYCKALLLGTKASPPHADGASPDTVFTFRASTETLDRQGEIVTADGWDTAEFEKNPVFLLAHDYRALPIGKVTKIVTDEGGLLADVIFDHDDETARQVESKFSRGFLNAVSVGFQPIEMEIPQGKNPGPPRHTKKALLEISAVAVPANPDALMVRMLSDRLRMTPEQISALLAPDRSSMAMPPHGGDMMDMEHEWNASAEVGQAEGAAQLKRMHAWMDAEGDPEAKSSYKLPHHMHSGEVVWRGVSAAGNVMMGGRGGVDMPESDMAGVKAHLARHYAQFKKTPPWEQGDDGKMVEDPPQAENFSAAWEALKEAMLAIVTDADGMPAGMRRALFSSLSRCYRTLGRTAPDFRSAEQLVALRPTEIRGLFWEGEAESLPAQKAGRVLSKKNESLLRQAHASLTQVLEQLATDSDATDTGDGGKGAVASDLKLDLSALQRFITANGA